jgi:mRNA-degrading endonuclease toxin of MazEF toxin-antitoxin module
MHPTYAEENPAYKACQVVILGKSQTSLPHESVVDCYDLYSISESELTECHGPIPEETIKKIKEVVNSTRVIIERRKKLILEP